MVSSGGGVSATYTSDYTEEVEEEKKAEPPSPQQKTKQVDRQTWKEAKPKLQELVDNFG